MNREFEPSTRLARVSFVGAALLACAAAVWAVALLADHDFAQELQAAAVHQTSGAQHYQAQARHDGKASHT